VGVEGTSVGVRVIVASSVAVADGASVGKKKVEVSRRSAPRVGAGETPVESSWLRRKLPSTVPTLSSVRRSPRTSGLRSMIH
jgi:hypothetical protein